MRVYRTHILLSPWQPCACIMQNVRVETMETIWGTNCACVNTSTYLDRTVSTSIIALVVALHILDYIRAVFSSFLMRFWFKNKFWLECDIKWKSRIDIKKKKNRLILYWSFKEIRLVELPRHAAKRPDKGSPKSFQVILRIMEIYATLNSNLILIWAWQKKNQMF